MISCSTSRTSPASVPSWIRDFISSSVTLLAFFFRPSNFTKKAVDTDRSHTSGIAATDSRCIGRDTTLATLLAAARPMRLGTSSPTTIDRYVTAATINIWPVVWARRG